MGLLVFDKMFEQIGHTDRRRSRTPRAEAIGSLMAETRRELAVLNAEMVGAQSYLGCEGGSAPPTRGDRRLFRDMIENNPQLFMIIDPRPGLHIVDINDAYAAATLTARRKAAGGKLFDVYPDNPDDPAADGVSNLYESIQRAVQTGREHAMAVQRYDVQDAAGAWIEKHWLPINIPLLDESGRLVFVVHRVLDVTPN